MSKEQELYDQVNRLKWHSHAGVEISSGTATDGYVLTADGAGKSAWEAAPGGSGGHTIMDEGSALTARANLDFVGAGVTVTDDAGNNKTIVTIPGGSTGSTPAATLIYMNATFA